MMKTLSKNLALKTLLQPRYSVRMRPAEIVLLFLVLLFGITLFGITLKESLLQSLLLFIFVTIAGLWLAHNTASELGDRKLHILGSLWLIKVAVTLLLLYLGWLPTLEAVPTAPVSSFYDAHRFYVQSQELLANDWNSSSIGINYFGIIYYYATIFSIFGVNPVLPALVNAFVTFLGIIFIVRSAYAFVPHFNKKSHYIAWLVLIPEVLWYDVMTSRETLMAVLLAIVILGTGSVLASVKKFNISGAAIVLLALFGILTIRTSMILCVVLSFSMMVLFIQNGRFSSFVLKFGLIVLSLGVLLGGIVIQRIMGGSDINYLELLSQIQDFESNVASSINANWSKNSIGLLLVPNSFLEMLVFLPFRMILYLAAPLPDIAVSLSALIDGEFNAWERLMTIPTSVLMLLGFPYVLAGSAYALFNRIQFPALLVIPIGFWVTFAAVAGGNIIIHERYRVMFTLLLFACMWLGFTQSRDSSVIRWAALWFGLLTAAAVFYVGYKFL